MPNWVTNNIRFDCTGSATNPSEIANYVKGRTGDGEEILFDFNKITPMPESLNIEAGSRGDTGYREYRKFIDEGKDKTPKQRDKLEERYINRVGEETWYLGKAYYMNEKRFGCTNWYDWCIRNWGTKWNACDVVDSEPSGLFWSVTFNTAWSAPNELIEKLSRIFPSVEIHHEWADEDIGNNLGSVTLRGGDVIDHDLPDSRTKEAYELAFRVLGIDDPKDELGLEFDESTGNYEWRDM